MADEITASQWAEKYRYLRRADSARPGPWKNSNAPYTTGLIDLATTPGVEQLNIEKASQIGMSEALRNLLAYWADIEPDPTGITLPDREKGRQIVADRILPLFKNTPRLARYVSSRAHDTKKSQIKLTNGFVLNLMWSGSPASMAADPMRRVINDEVDKHAPWAGRESSSIALTWRRLETYEDRKIQINLSTPTTRAGRIHQLVEASGLRIYYHVPCPHCGGYQRLIFGRLRYKHFSSAGDKDARARKVVRNKAAWFECQYCQGRIDEQPHKASIVRAGIWATETAVDADGRPQPTDLSAGIVWDAPALDAYPAGTRVGAQIGAFYSLWRSWPAIAAEWIRAAGDFDATFDFRTNTEGEPFERQIERARPDVLSDKCARAPLPEGIIPGWAAKLIASIDTQQDHFYLVIRAWGPGMKSARVYHGRVETFEALHELAFEHPWRVEADRFVPQIPDLVVIDSGGTRLPDADSSGSFGSGGHAATRTMEVYRWCHARRARTRAIKGAALIPRSAEHKPFWLGTGTLKDLQGRKQLELPLIMVNTGFCNDVLADLMFRGVPKVDPTDPTAAPAHDPGDDPAEEIWLLNDRDDPTYNAHISAVHKVEIPTSVAGRRQVVGEWKPLHAGTRHDYRDCEVYQVAAAYMAHVHLLPDQAEFEKFRDEQLRLAAPTPEGRGRPRRTGKDDAWTPQPISDDII